MRKPGEVKCPTCRLPGDWFGGPYGPFCSQRCKLVDLGEWFEEEHVISRPLTPNDAQRMTPELDDDSES
jgi:endogenous inhibitor of DNA gyrase (YacG/DUF329 family)